MPPTTQVTAPATPARAPAPPRERHLRKRRLVLFPAAVLLIGGAVVMAPAVLRLLDDPAGSAPVTGIVDVTIRDDRFDPPVVEVPAGTTLTWHFDDGGAAHNVVGDGWQSETLTSGSFAHTFEKSGTYPYTCTLHWGMDGRVEVIQP